MTSVVVTKIEEAPPFLRNSTKVNRMLICRPNNRLGNQLLMTPLIQELCDVFPECKIDLFVRGNLSTVLFQHYHNIDQIIKLPNKPFKELLKYTATWLRLRKYKYDLVINVTENSSSGRLSTRFARTKARLFCSQENFSQVYRDSLHLAKAPVYCLRHFLSGTNSNSSGKPIPPLDLNLSESELAKGKALLKNIVGNEKDTICLFTYATGNKCYSKSWWKSLYSKIKTAYGDKYNLIEVLPKENVSQIEFAEPVFYSLDLREIGAIMASTTVFIGADSGMMHLASAVNVPTFALFSITDPEIYGPYNAGSMSIDTSRQDPEEIVKLLGTVLD